MLSFKSNKDIVKYITELTPRPEEEQIDYYKLLDLTDVDLAILDNDLEECTKNGMHLKNVKYQTLEICIAAVKQNGLSLKYIKHQTNEICEFACEQNGCALKYVKLQTYDLCKLSVKQNGMALEYINGVLSYMYDLPSNYYDFSPGVIEEFNMLAIKQNGKALKFVKYPTEELCKIAVSQTGRAIKYIPSNMLTLEICKIACANDGTAIEFVNDETEELREIALNQSPDAINYMDEMCIHSKDIKVPVISLKKYIKKEMILRLDIMIGVLEIIPFNNKSIIEKNPIYILGLKRVTKLDYEYAIELEPEIKKIPLDLINFEE